MLDFKNLWSNIINVPSRWGNLRHRFSRNIFYIIKWQYTSRLREINLYCSEENMFSNIENRIAEND